MDPAAHRALISGERRRVLPSLARGALAACSVFYGAGVRARNAAFDCGCRRTYTAGVPVVSVGNVTTGGTGKTPVVAWLANWLSERGVRPAILSRGYRALDETTNDEKLVLDRLCPGVPHVQNPDRVAGARQAIREFGAEMLILDDGFQHRRLRRDLDIVLIDALQPFGYGRLLPRGLLREPLSGLRRADLIAITRADRLTGAGREAILAAIAPWRPTGEAPVEIAFSPLGLVNELGERNDMSAIRGRAVAAFCGIGNPAGFRGTLEDAGANVVEWREFPDHHHYTAADVRELVARARSAGAILVTTLKDLVKIRAEWTGGFPVWAIDLGARIVRGGDLWERRLDGVLLLARKSEPEESGRRQPDRENPAVERNR